MNTLFNNYYHKNGCKQTNAFIDKDHKFDQKLAHDNSQNIHSKKDFIKWLQK